MLSRKGWTDTTMSKRFFILWIWIVAGWSAQADVLFRSAIPGTFDVVYTLPSGEEKSQKIYGNRDGFGAGSINQFPSTLKSINVKIVDDLGTVILSGPVLNESYCLIYLKDDGKPFLQQCGWCADSGQDKPSAVGVVNLTGKPLVLSLFGQQGTAGLKDMPLPQVPNFQPFRLPAGETYFRVNIPGMQFTEQNPGVSVGRFYSVLLNAEGKLDWEELGLIKSPFRH